MTSLLFNMLSRFVVDFLLRSKCLHFMAAVIVHSDFGVQENKEPCDSLLEEEALFCWAVDP